jgi:hypothetical protein
MRCGKKQKDIKNVGIENEKKMLIWLQLQGKPNRVNNIFDCWKVFLMTELLKSFPGASVKSLLEMTLI